MGWALLRAGQGRVRWELAFACLGGIGISVGFATFAIWVCSRGGDPGRWV